MSEHEHDQAGFEISEVDLGELIERLTGSGAWDPENIVDQPEKSSAMVKVMSEQVKTLDVVVDQFNNELDALAIPHRVDEVAMIFRDTAQLLAWVSLAVRIEGWEHFGAALDDVDVPGPIHGHYRAHYEFIRLLDRPYRIEAMSVPSGHSPLHASHLYITDGVGTFVHVSFKCADEMEYSAVTSHLSESGLWLPAQICRSNYGRFTYFNTSPEHQQEMELPSMALKPRVNLRDSR